MITSQLLHPASIVVVGASNNVHKPGGAILKNLISGGYTGELRENLEKMLNIVSSLHNHLSSLAVSGETARKELPALANEEIQKINHYQLELLRLIDSERLSLRSSELYLSLLQCTREIINRYTIVMVLQGELSDMCEPARA